VMYENNIYQSDGDVVGRMYLNSDNDHFLTLNSFVFPHQQNSLNTIRNKSVVLTFF